MPSRGSTTTGTTAPCVSSTSTTSPSANSPTTPFPPYLVTSHRWTDDEATHKDVLKRRNHHTRGFQKVERFCAFARKHAGRESRDNQWIWIDTCCIDQKSSAELSESINSMWAWYSQSSHCIAYLKDVRPLASGREAVLFDFRRSEWFERGWTLQELLAPQCVIFLTREFEVIGRKSPVEHECPVAPYLLNRSISEITGIPQDILCGFESRRDTISKEVKMQWAANRRTTKAEDMSYCLLGIFDLAMPLLYGEGETRARRRLEVEIKRRELEEDDFLLAPTRSVTAATASQPPSRSTTVGNSQTSHYPRQDHIPSLDEQCPICRLLLLEPVTTDCGHTVCESCMVTDDSLHLTIVPIESESEVVAAGDAATRNFQADQRCPYCGEHGSESEATLFAPPNLKLAKRLRVQYTSLYAQRLAELDKANEGIQTVTINIGNWHELDGPNRHHWTFFVKPSRTDIITEVHIDLHHTFRNPHIVRKKPPYAFHGKGWGYFNIAVRLWLRPGPMWLSRDAEDGAEVGEVGRVLRMRWTLDFQSFGGRGAMGRCRVRVGRRAAVAAADAGVVGGGMSQRRERGLSPGVVAEGLRDVRLGEDVDVFGASYGSFDAGAGVGKSRAEVEEEDDDPADTVS